MKVDPAVKQLLLPLRIGIDPMERLVVVSCKGNPEFETVEPQLFDDKTNGKGVRILRYRRDGRVDVYWQSGVNVDRKSIEIGAGIADFSETAVERSRFEITERGLDLDIAFIDGQGRRNELRIKENRSSLKCFPLLAPVGADIENPKQLFLVYMTDFDFVRRKGTSFEGRIGDWGLKPASLPLLLHGQRIWMIRYVDKPVIGTVNPDGCRPLVVPFPVPDKAMTEEMRIETTAGGGVTEICSGEKNRCIRMNFIPGFPNLSDLTEGEKVSGQWRIRISGVKITGGKFTVERSESGFDIELDVLEHWQPHNLPLSMKMLVLLIRKFRSWPATYRWRGRLIPGDPPEMQGIWERKTK